MSNNSLPSFMQPGNINGVQFSVMSPDDIRDGSSVEIVTHETYDGNDPKIGGLFDTRMGVIDNGRICATCHHRNDQCPGHFGHLELASPVFCIQYIQTTMKLLKCVCYVCGNILIESKHFNNIKAISNNSKRFAFAYSLTKTFKKEKYCPISSESSSDVVQSNKGCNCLQPYKYVKDSVARIYGEFKLPNLKDGSSDSVPSKVLITAEDCLRIFKRISDEDCDLLGFAEDYCMPNWLLWSVMPVSPPAVRPSVSRAGDPNQHDDITFKLVELIKTNKLLKQKIQANSKTEILDDYKALLQYHVATLIDNELQGVQPTAHRSGRPLRTHRQRLKGKEGRIRGYLMGKRVDYSARTVITADPNIEIEQIGIPIKIATNLTYKEIVTRNNIKKLTDYITNTRRDPNYYPGVKFVTRENGERISVHHCKEDIKLNLRDVVSRHLMDDDIILFNRQPSLHKMSMMGHRVKVMPYDTFRLNVCVTTPYNADFDGDEMNLHVPQSIQTEEELKRLTLVPTQIISPAKSAPVIGMVQDAMLGAYTLTRKIPNSSGVDVGELNTLTRKEVNDLIIWNDKFNKEYHGKINELSGLKVYSTIIPRITYEKSGIRFNQGTFISDLPVTKAHVGVGSKNGIHHVIHNDIGMNGCKEFLDDAQRIANNWIMMSSHSVGIGDCIINEELQKNIDAEIDDVIKRSLEKITKAEATNKYMFFESKEDMIDHFEREILGILNNHKVGSILDKNISQTNRIKTIVDSGSKGNSTNIQQIAGCIGSSAVDGKRVPFYLDQRTLPHFVKNDLSPEARGFVKSSFLEGLKPHEFYFHAMGGREGLIDTAVKTSKSGYISRKMIKALEDLKVGYDGIVSNANGMIIQFVYGNDGFDGSRIEKQTIDIGLLSEDDFEQKYKIEPNGNASISEEYSQLKDDRKYLQMINTTTEEISLSSPINMDRIIEHVSIEHPQNPQDSITPDYIWSAVKTLTIDDGLLRASIGSLNRSRIIEILIRTKLAIKQIINLSKTGFDYIISRIKYLHTRAIIQPGEMVGVIAAQSVSEPATQMTLNTFHYAGVASKSQITRGLSRFEEILDLAKNPKVQTMDLFMSNSYVEKWGNKVGDTDEFNIQLKRSMVNNFKNLLEYTTILNFATSSSIEYGLPSSGLGTVLSLQGDSGDSGDSEELNSNTWTLTIELNREKMLARGLTTMKIYMQVLPYVNKISKAKVNKTDDNAPHVRLYITSQDITELQSLENDIINNIPIKGIVSIKSVDYDPEDKEFDYSITDSNGNSKTLKLPKMFTIGSNIMESILFDTQYENQIIDHTKTYSNNIIEIYDILGIEAARSCIIQEINTALNYGCEQRHVNLLVDIMTIRGKLMSINRHGINKNDIGPLAKCSFEETTEQFFKAAMFGEKDNLSGVSSNIMLGKVPPVGSSSFDVMYSDELAKHEIEDYDYSSDVDGDLYGMEDEFDEREIPMSKCTENNMGFAFNLTEDYKFGKDGDRDEDEKDKKDKKDKKNTTIA